MLNFSDSADPQLDRGFPSYFLDSLKTVLRLIFAIRTHQFNNLLSLDLESMTSVSTSRDGSVCQSDIDQSFFEADLHGSMPTIQNPEWQYM